MFCLIIIYSEFNFVNDAIAKKITLDKISLGALGAGKRTLGASTTERKV